MNKNLDGYNQIEALTFLNRLLLWLVVLIFIFIPFILFAQPKIKEVVMLSSVRVNFNEPVDSTALNPANYWIVFGVNLSNPPVRTHPNFVVYDVEFINDTSFQQSVKLTTELHILGWRYLVTVSNVRDLAGNVIGEFNKAYYYGD